MRRVLRSAITLEVGDDCFSFMELVFVPLVYEVDLASDSLHYVVCITQLRTAF